MVCYMDFGSCYLLLGGTNEQRKNHLHLDLE
uniref:Uncharacterized protein n=1 Tax=Arundo donax TaxID=35708 RepID=A0A0A8ZW82_ARUDO